MAKAKKKSSKKDKTSKKKSEVISKDFVAPKKPTKSEKKVEKTEKKVEKTDGTFATKADWKREVRKCSNAIKSERQRLQAFMKDNKFKTAKDVDKSKDKDIKREYGVFEENILGLENNLKAVKELEPASTPRTSFKYDYPEGLTDAEKKKFRAKARRERAAGETGEEKPKKTSKKSKDEKSDKPKSKKKNKEAKAPKADKSSKKEGKKKIKKNKKKED